MTTQNEKNARKTLVVQEVLNTLHHGFFEEFDAEEFQLMLVSRGYLVMAL